MQMGDTVFMFFCALLVWLMTPGLALFYGGMVKSKNVLSTAMHSFSSIAIVSIVWVLFGYTLAFAPGNSIIGGLEWAGLKGVGFDPGDYSDTIPHSLFMMFQMTFAVLTTAIISGAFAERMRFGAFLLFSVLWASLVYTPVAHWVWGGGWIGQLGALDFAGGNVVHISSGVAGLVLAIVLGKRKDGTASSPHNLIYTFLGGALIWFGWFGFNVGSALTLDGVAMYAFINTNTAAAAGIAGWILVEWIINKNRQCSERYLGQSPGLSPLRRLPDLSHRSLPLLSASSAELFVSGEYSRLKRNSDTTTRLTPLACTGSAAHGAESQQDYSQQPLLTQRAQMGYLR